MGTNIERGFTVIETMLFLAISAVLVVALLAGSGTSINIQRYHDSVTGLQNLIQDQYFQVTNVSNTSATTRGQGDCVLIGKYVTIVDFKLSSDTLTGCEMPKTEPYTDDIDELQNYKLAVQPESNESSDLEWGTRIAWPKDSGTQTTPRTIAMLILRSPTSGLVYTFTANDVPSKLEDIVIKGNTVPGQGEQTLCIDPNGLFAGGLSIFVNSYASSSNAIEIRSNDTLEEGDSKC